MNKDIEMIIKHNPHLIPKNSVAERIRNSLIASAIIPTIILRKLMIRYFTLIMLKNNGERLLEYLQKFDTTKQQSKTDIQIQNTALLSNKELEKLKKELKELQKKLDRELKNLQKHVEDFENTFQNIADKLAGKKMSLARAKKIMNEMITEIFKQPSHGNKIDFISLLQQKSGLSKKDSEHFFNNNSSKFDELSHKFKLMEESKTNAKKYCSEIEYLMKYLIKSTSSNTESRRNIQEQFKQYNAKKPLAFIPILSNASNKIKEEEKSHGNEPILTLN